MLRLSVSTQKPPPPLDEYVEWTMGHPNRRARNSPSPAMIRRMVVMIRNGEQIKQAAKMTGCSPGLYATLPEHLK